MIKTASIPLDRVRLRLIANPKKLDMRTLWKTYGGENKILINGPFFDFSTFKPTVHLKMDGKVICAPNYGEWGIAWNDGQPPVWVALPAAGYDNYMTNTVVVPKDGKPRAELTSHADADGTRSKPRYTSRPAWGFKGGNFKLRVITTGTSLWGLQSVLVENGWDNAIVGDGGGSTAWKDSTSEIYTSRKIPYWILVETIDNEPKGEKPDMNGATVRVYSLKKDGKKKLSGHFAVKEFACNDGTDTIFISNKLVDLLEKMRNKIGRAVYISSGYRTEAKNKAVGGAEFSQHKYGCAADIWVSGWKPEQVAAVAEELMPNTGGIGIYAGFVHVDVRPDKAQWRG